MMKGISSYTWNTVTFAFHSTGIDQTQLQFRFTELKGIYNAKK